MNVLSVIYHPVYSGPHNRTRIVAELLAEQGVHTTIVVPNGGNAAPRLIAEGLDVVPMTLHRMRAVRSVRVHAQWIRFLRSEVRQLSNLIQERKIDVVATNTLPNLHGGLAARSANVPCVWQIIDTYPPPVARRVYTPVVLRLADVVMTTGIEVARQHPGVPRLGDRWLTFYPCVDTEQFSASREIRLSARAELGIRPNATVIGNVAAISPMKGHKYFLDAAADLKATHPNTQFVILGSQQKEALAQFNKSLWQRAADLGLTLGEDLIVVDPQRRVHELAQAIDIFWMTSEPNSEGIPTAIGEAKALGIPVVATDVGAIRECVTDEVSGYVVPPRRPRLIADATRSMLNDRNRYNSMKVAARNEAERQFAAHLGAEKHKIAYARAIEIHRRRREFLS